jgi:signal peptidase I
MIASTHRFGSTSIAKGWWALAILVSIFSFFGSVVPAQSEVPTPAKTEWVISKKVRRRSRGRHILFVNKAQAFFRFVFSGEDAIQHGGRLFRIGFKRIVSQYFSIERSVYLIKPAPSPGPDSSAFTRLA